MPFGGIEFKLGPLLVYVFLLPNLRTLQGFGPRFTADRSESVTHFLFLCHFGWSHCRVMRRRCQRWISVVLCNAWLMNVGWERAKVKPYAGIIPLLSKSTKKGAPGLASHPTYKSLSTNRPTLRRDLWFNSGIFGTETRDKYSALTSLPIPVLGKNLFCLYATEAEEWFWIFDNIFAK